MHKSELAVIIYDEDGEDAMLVYLAYACRYPEEQMWDRNMTCALPDGSSVLVSANPDAETPDRYTFRWAGEDGLVEAHRPMRGGGRFDVPEPCRNAPFWPDTDSIQLLLLERARGVARRRLGHPKSDEPDSRDRHYLLSMMQRTAPSARAAVNKVIDQSINRRELFDALDDAQQTWVDVALSFVSAVDYEALVQAEIEHIQSGT